MAQRIWRRSCFSILAALINTLLTALLRQMQRSHILFVSNRILTRRDTLIQLTHTSQSDLVRKSHRHARHWELALCVLLSCHAPNKAQEQSIKQSHNISLLLGGVNMIVYAIFATVSWFIIERAGRRKLFLWGTVGQALSMLITFSCLIKDTPANARGAAVGLFTYIASFGATWLPLPWLYPAEINPIKTRAKANAVSTCTNWLFVSLPYTYWVVESAL